MSSFTAPLILEALSTERRGLGEFRVHEAFRYDIGYLGSGDSVTVPAGYRTDLCSVPCFARPFIPISGRVAKPALLHDWLLEQGDRRAHAVFDEALGVAGVPRLQKAIMILCVKSFQRWKEWYQRLLP